MLLNNVMATEGQIEKINKEYLPGILSHASVVYDDEDEIFFIKVECLGYFYEYQMRANRCPCFVGLRKGDSRYNIPYPDPKSTLYIRLKEIGDRMIKDWEAGNLL